jgi:FkbM family methyltransferase
MNRSPISELFQQLRSTFAASTPSALFSDGGPVLIYGAGNVGKDVFRLLTARGVSVLGFLDRQARPGAAWQGVPVWLPDDPAALALQRSHCHALIGIFNAYVEIPPIVATLKALGYGRVTTFLDLHDQFPTELGDRFWLTARSYYASLESQLAAGYELWSDETSRALYIAILRGRLMHDHAALRRPDAGPQYFATDLPAWTTPLRFVDCGAFDGDTLRQLAGSGLAVEAVAAFEPDPVNFVKLAHYVRSQRASFPAAVALFPCGVHSSTEQLQFRAGQGAGSHASTSGDTGIQCVSLDEALPCFRPNLIKMDIEGAEYAALWGARQTLAEHRPGLAICLYHRPEHLWQIPLLVRDWKLGYRFYLRVHCFNGFELVLYALPTS